MKKFIVAMLAGSALALALVLLPGAKVETVAAAEQSKDNKKSQEVVYTYVAQPGDSYSLMARKAIQTYGQKYKVNLSQAKILFAETNLTQDAGSPQLLQGQKVEIKESAVKKWVDQAKDLNSQKEAQWQVYVPGTNFDTSSVGQSS